MDKIEGHRDTGDVDRRPRLKNRAPVLLVSAVLATSLLLGLLVVTATRSYLIEAQTFGATITFRGGANAWELESAIICRRRTVPVPELGLDEICPPAFYDISGPDSLILPWADGDQIALELNRDGYFKLTKLAGPGQGLNAGDQALIPPTSWTGHGALMVQGAILLGADIGPGANDYLLSGIWEARQRTFVPALGSTSLAAVKSGNFARGTTVQVVNSRAPAVVFGHITPSLERDGSGFIATFVSEAGRVDLHLRYYGRADHVLLRPNLIDTVVASPILLAASIILSLLASAKDLFGLRSGGGLAPAVKYMIRRRRR